MDLDNNTVNNWDKWKKTLYNVISVSETVGLQQIIKLRLLHKTELH